MRTDIEPGVRANEPIDFTEAAQEFGMRIKEASARRSIACGGGRYEVRPCRDVRGFTLKLPVIGWQLWFPDSQSATRFAGRVASIHRAGCSIYDSSGRLVSR